MSRRRLTPANVEKPAVIDLEVETQLGFPGWPPKETRHLAFTYPKPVSTWTLDDVRAVMTFAATLLPTRSDVRMSDMDSIEWMEFRGRLEMDFRVGEWNGIWEMTAKCCVDATAADVLRLGLTKISWIKASDLKNELLLAADRRRPLGVQRFDAATAHEDFNWACVPDVGAEAAHDAMDEHREMEDAKRRLAGEMAIAYAPVRAARKKKVAQVTS